MDTLDGFALDKLAGLDRARTRRRMVDTFRDGPTTARRDGRQMISFCCNDYLNLTHHPAVIEAAVAATRQYGAGSGASRLVTGNHPLYRTLEAKLAALKGTEDALVFGSGYLANVSITPALVGRGDLVLIDELAHACLFTGARLSGASVRRFAHNDTDDAGRILAQERASHGKCMLLTDHVFSMDGDIAPISELAELCSSHDTWLLADDAHGIGMLPIPAGATVPLQMGTLSKALGSYGGYLCASAPVIDLLRSRARALVYTTGLPPASVAAAIAALDLIAADPAWAASPIAKARRFTAALGLPPAASPIVPLIVGDAATALAQSERLADAGFLVTAIRPPTVPEGTARLRFTFTASHADAEIDALATAVGRLGA